MKHTAKSLAPRMAAADQFGALHLVVSDGNVDNENIKFCLSDPNITEEERELAKDLLSVPEQVREDAYFLVYVDEEGGRS
jgi:hypothetical protein